MDHVTDANTPGLVAASAAFARRRLPKVAGGLSALRTRSRLLKVLAGLLHSACCILLVAF